MKAASTLLAILLIVTGNLFSQISEVINYQGRLTDNEGIPVENNSYYVTFSLYDNEWAESSIWSEELEVKTHDGFFNVNLGEINSFDSLGLKFDKTYYLGIKLPAETEFFPRTKLAVTPYSFTAKKLEFPYIDTIETTSGIKLTMREKGPALLIDKSFGRALEINNSEENSGFPVVSINDSGRGGAIRASADGFRSTAGYFTTSNPANRAPTLQIYNYGMGNAMYIANENKADTMPVIYTSNQSMGYTFLIHSLSTFDDKPAILLNALGAGGGAEFRVLNTSNIMSPFIANTWGLGTAGEFASFNTNNKNTTLNAVTMGKNPVANFKVLSETSDTTGFYFLTKSIGPGADFRIDNLLNEKSAVTVTTKGKGDALFAMTSGIGSAARFESNSETYSPTVYAVSNSDYPAIYATNKADGPAAKFIIDTMNSTDGPVVLIDHQGGGNALRLHSNANPLQPALSIKKEGIDGIAAVFDGHVKINGELQKMSGSFVIDHPLDPGNKLLAHSFVESPDMKNIYDGVVTLDQNGEAVITLPDWFEALNEEFRYQLTCIGGWAQVYISEEVKNNSFKISGGKPNMKVSWMLTGIRHDPWAEQQRIKVERDKPNGEKGKYLYPEYYENK